MGKKYHFKLEDNEILDSNSIIEDNIDNNIIKDDSNIESLIDNIDENVIKDNFTIVSEPIIEEKKEEEVITDNTTPQQIVNIKVNFSKSAIQIDYIIAATGQKDKIIAANGELRMMQGRFYFIPVDCDSSIDSDNHAVLKVFSDISEYLDVRYVKQGFACVYPLRHNVTINHEQRLCVLL